MRKTLVSVHSFVAIDHHALARNLYIISGFDLDTAPFRPQHLRLGAAVQIAGSVEVEIPTRGQGQCGSPVQRKVLCRQAQVPRCMQRDTGRLDAQHNPSARDLKRDWGRSIRRDQTKLIAPFGLVDQQSMPIREFKSHLIVDVCHSDPTS